MTMKKLRAIVCVIVGGAATLIAAVFLALQWGSQSRFSAFGPERTTRTVYLVLGAAAGGVLVFWLARGMLSGLLFLWRERRQANQGPAEANRKSRRP